MYTDVLERTVNELENEKNQVIAEKKARVMQEKVEPFKREIDESRDKAITQLQAENNEKIRVIQESFEAQRREIINEAEKKKADYEKLTLDTAVALIVSDYDRLVKSLRETVDTIKNRDGVI